MAHKIVAESVIEYTTAADLGERNDVPYRAKVFATVYGDTKTGPAGVDIGVASGYGVLNHFFLEASALSALEAVLAAAKKHFDDDFDDDDEFEEGA